MIGTLNSSKKDAAIIGGGISGLLAAHTLIQLGYEVSLYESTHRLGGLIKTEKSDFGISEKAANSVLASVPVIDLFNELRTELCPVQKGSNKKYVLRGGVPRTLPLTVTELFATIGKAFFSRSDGQASLSMKDWALKHLGAAALNYLIDPMLKGIYAAEPQQISVSAAFPKLVVPKGHSLISGLAFCHEKKKSKRGPRAQMMAPRGGMEALVNALESSIKPKLRELKLGYTALNLPKASNVVICVPAYAAAAFFRTEEQNDLANALEQVHYTPLITSTVFYHRKEVSRLPMGVGILFPSIEKRNLLGILCSSDSFPGRVTDPSLLRSFTVLLGGTARGDIMNLDDERVSFVIREELEKLFQVKAPPIHINNHRWTKAIPIYSSQIEKVWEVARATWCAQPGKILFGNYTGQVSIRGLIEEARELLIE
ncbi:MAG: FAD-dependent oxidoreductase [Deltaproteobacteria bacterium]|nr:FAD-dependent oxidoreductase [Deltaproteobacteria bacterium]